MVLKLAVLAVLAVAAVRAQTFDACHKDNHEVVEGEEWRWRHNRIHPQHGQARCDAFSAQAWRRFKAESGEDLVNQCPPKHSCGTHHPIWMNGTVPKESEGEARRTACLHKDDKCCAEIFTLTVKNCGNFRVYKFDIKPQQPNCDKAYCVGDKKPCDDDDDRSSGEEDDSSEEGKHGRKHHRKQKRHHKKDSSSSEEGSHEENGEGKCYRGHRHWRFMRLAIAVGVGGLSICTIVLITCCCVACCKKRRGRTTLVPRAPEKPAAVGGYFAEKPPLDTNHVVCVDMKRPLFDSLENTYATAEPEEQKGPAAEKYQVA